MIGPGNGGCGDQQLLQLAAAAGTERLEELRQWRAKQKAEALRQRKAASDNAAQLQRNKGGGTAKARVTAEGYRATVARDEGGALLPVGPEGMCSELGRALAACGTSNSWSTLEAVAGKVSRRLGRKVTPRELDALMVGAGDSALLKRGVWRTSFGKKYMPIVVVNTAFARTAGATAGTAAEQWACSCGAAPTTATGRGGRGGAATKARAQRDAGRYFGSVDYNAGRHACTASVHKGHCLLWRPPTSGHLHSWRRGFTDT